MPQAYDQNHEQALQLIAEITHGPAVSEVWEGNGQHPCARVVNTQDHNPGTFQVPEPWAGNLDIAPLLLVSSNPSISEDEPYPVWVDDEANRAEFFDQRFGDGNTQVRDGVRFPLKQPNSDGTWHSKRAVPFWRDCLANVEFLLGHPVEPGLDYVMTEVVHCKSRGEGGVPQATSACMERWFDRVLALSPSRVVVLLGVAAVRAVEDRVGTSLPLWQPIELELGGRQRLVMAARHPNSHGPRRWQDLMDPAVVEQLRYAIDDAHHQDAKSVANLPGNGVVPAVGAADDLDGGGSEGRGRAPPSLSGCVETSRSPG